MSFRSSIYLSLLATLIMMVLYTLSSVGMLGDSPVGQTSVDSQPLIVPSGYAFAIWGIIYPLLIIFPIYQLIKKRSDSELWHKVRIWFSLNVVANGLWLAFASYNWLWTTALIIAFMLVTLYQINSLLVRIKAEGQPITFWSERLVFSIYFAWITLATVLNVSSALSFYDWDGFGISEVTWTLIILSVTVIIAGATFSKYRDSFYGGVVIWAFLALIVKHWGLNPSIAYLSIGVVLLFLGLIISRGKLWAGTQS